MKPDYKQNDPRGWYGDMRRGAAMGRPTIKNADAEAPIKLYLRKVYLNNGGYDTNGTYFGTGTQLWWYADADGQVDAMVRAADRGTAIEMIRQAYPLATFFR